MRSVDNSASDEESGKRNNAQEPYSEVLNKNNAQNPFYEGSSEKNIIHTPYLEESSERNDIHKAYDEYASFDYYQEFGQLFNLPDDFLGLNTSNQLGWKSTENLENSSQIYDYSV
ncbi:17809_t:CDS:2, partial [Racocetra persica]